MQNVYVGVPDCSQAQQKNPAGVAYMFVEFVAQNFLYLSLACIYMLNGLDFSPMPERTTSRKLYLLQSLSCCKWEE